MTTGHHSCGAYILAGSTGEDMVAAGIFTINFEILRHILLDDENSAPDSEKRRSVHLPLGLPDENHLLACSYSPSPVRKWMRFRVAFMAWRGTLS